MGRAGPWADENEDRAEPGPARSARSARPLRGPNRRFGGPKKKKSKGAARVRNANMSYGILWNSNLVSMEFV